MREILYFILYILYLIFYIGGISISGVALAPWAQTKYAPEKARRFAATLGCPTRNTKEMIDCLQTRPARILSQATGEVVNCYYFFILILYNYNYIYFHISFESLITA